MTQPTVNFYLTQLRYLCLNIRWEIAQIFLEVVKHSQVFIRPACTTGHILIDDSSRKAGGDDLIVVRRIRWITEKDIPAAGKAPAIANVPWPQSVYQLRLSPGRR